MSHELRLALCAGLAAIVSCGCGGLQVSGEKVFITFQPQRDEANLLLTYHDLHVTGDKKDLDEARKQLDSLFKDRSTFIALPPFLIPLAPTDDMNEDQRKVWEILQEHVSLGEAALTLDQNGLLDGYQRLKVRELRRFVAEANAMISKVILNDSSGALANTANNRSPAENKSWRLLRKALLRKEGQAKPTWLGIEDGQITINLVATPEDVGKIAREAEAFLHFAGDNEWCVSRRGNRLAVSIGSSSATPIRLCLSEPKAPKRTLVKEMHEHAVAICPGLSKNPPLDKVVARFLAEPMKPLANN